MYNIKKGWLCVASHPQRGNLETAPPFTLPCEGLEARFLHRSHRESNSGPSRGSPLHNRCATPAPFKKVVCIYIEILVRTNPHPSIKRVIHRRAKVGNTYIACGPFKQ